MRLRFLTEYHRKKLLKKAHLPKPLSQYLSQLSRPLADNVNLIKDLEFLVLDFETTGFDASKEKIISMGYTVIKNLRILPQTSTHILVNPKQVLTEKNVAIHQLTDEELKQGISLESAMDRLLLAMTGRVIIVHFDNVEKGFINQACRQLYRINALPMVMLDTLKIEQKKRQQTQQQIKSGGLRLFALREKYNLPRYNAHNAIQDAIATAELFLAQIEYMGKKETLKLKQLI